MIVMQYGVAAKVEMKQKRVERKVFHIYNKRYRLQNGGGYILQL